MGWYIELELGNGPAVFPWWRERSRPKYRSAIIGVALLEEKCEPGLFLVMLFGLSA